MTELCAPKIDKLLHWFERGHMNPSEPSEEIKAAMEPLFQALAPLAPLKENDEAKAIWLKIPRGDISDYTSFEKLKEYGEVSTYEEYLEYWSRHYPDEFLWYELVIVESFNKNGSLRFRGVSVGRTTIISASMEGSTTQEKLSEDAAVELCGLLTKAAKEAIQKLRDGTYNDEVQAQLPYWFRTGVIRRNVLWDYDQEQKRYDLTGMTESTMAEFQKLIESGVNDEMKIGRLDRMTANAFYRACAIAYKACGLRGTGLPPVDQYFLNADGRDEGLSGRGNALEKGTGVDPDDPDAWDQWFFDWHRGGGHPWEIIRGGNSTHVDLIVRHDRNMIGWKVRTGEITPEEAEHYPCGFFFEIHGKHRSWEAVHIYLALSAAGLPVILSDAVEILARFLATDYIGIVPHAMIPKYCEGMFPKRFGRVIDFMHVYEEELEAYGDKIEWLPVQSAALKEE